MKRLISLVIFIQVGSKLWVNPATVSAVITKEGSRYCENGAEIILVTGTDVRYPSLCSDWDAQTVLRQLSYAK